MWRFCLDLWFLKSWIRICWTYHRLSPLRNCTCKYWNIITNYYIITIIIIFRMPIVLVILTRWPDSARNAKYLHDLSLWLDWRISCCLLRYAWRPRCTSSARTITTSRSSEYEATKMHLTSQVTCCWWSVICSRSDIWMKWKATCTLPRKPIKRHIRWY